MNFAMLLERNQGRSIKESTTRAQDEVATFELSLRCLHETIQYLTSDKGQMSKRTRSDLITELRKGLAAENDLLRGWKSLLAQESTR